MIDYIRNDVEIKRIVIITLDNKNELVRILRNFIKLNYIIIQANFFIQFNVSCEPEDVLLNSQIPKIEEGLKIYVFQKMIILNTDGAALIN
jgi:hypothetical protein